MTLPSQQLTPQHAGAPWHGLFPALVTDLEDPFGRGRVQVELPWLPAGGGGNVTAWAELVTPYADDQQGYMMLPEVGSTVVVGFWWGDVDHPYVIGATWNGNAAPPEQASNANDRRLIASRSGSRLVFDDTQGSVKVQLSSGGAPGIGVNTVTLDDGGRSITIEGAGGATITLTASGGVEIDATTVTVTASMVTVDSPMTQFNGVVTCDTLIAKGGGVVSPSYTPGAGNVW